MSIIPCWGIHSDEVGLKYLVQEGKPLNAHGFTDSPKFNVKSFKKFKCPHRHEVTDLGIELEDSKGLDLFSPIPSKEKLFSTELPLSELMKACELNGNTFSMRPAFALTEYTLLESLYASNITTTVIYGLTYSNSTMVKRILNSRHDMQGVIILKGRYLFPNSISVLEEEDLPPTNYGKEHGQQRMYDYMKETNGGL